MNIIEMSNVHKIYGVGYGRAKIKARTPTVHALRGVDLVIEPGEKVAIMGKSGSGKSTLLNILGAIDRMNEGEYRFDGQPVRLDSPSKAALFRRNNVGFVVQDFALIEDMTVFENIALPLRQRRLRGSTIRQKVEAIAEELGIQDKTNKLPVELSGGEQQRVAIGRAIVHEPRLLLADEPTGALDEETERGILEIFDRLHKSGQTIIIVTHDRNVAATCGRTIRLRDGRVDETEEYEDG